MAKFDYVARDESGNSTTGEIVAESRNDAAKILRGSGKFVVHLEPAAERNGPAVVRQGSKRVKHHQIIYFANQLAIMVDTGVPLPDALSATIEDEPPSGFRSVVEDVISRVESGQPFSTALGRHPKAFPKYFVNIIRASEASGLLGTMLQRVATYMNYQRETRKRVTRAMMYPAAMVSFCIMVAIFLMIYLIPKFITIFESRGAALPRPTRMLIGTSGFLTDNVFWLLPLAVCVIGGSIYYSRTAAGRVVASWLQINTPVFGEMFRKANITTSTRTMGTLLEAGVSMLETIAITRDNVTNHYYAVLFQRVDDNLRKGNLLSDSLKGTDLFPRTVVQMIQAGERAGQMGPVMGRIADFCDRDLDNAIHTAVQLVQPALVVFMGVFIGGVVMALLLPIFSLSRVIAGTG